MTLVRILLMTLALGLAAGCNDDSSRSSSAEPVLEPLPPRPLDPNAKPVPRFNADSAYAFVAKQVAFGPRVMNTPAHDAARDWMIAKLEEFGAEVESQNFVATAYDGTALNGTNIIGRYNPEMEDRIVLAAHYDTRHVADSQMEEDPKAVVEGADDGASGVGVLLELARQLGQSTPSIGVDIILFDAEDYGGNNTAESWALGSQHYARNLEGRRPRYGILLDMVGSKDARFRQEENSIRYAPQVVRKVWGLARNFPKYANYFPLETQRAVIDDHLFVNTLGGYPMANIINFRDDTYSGFVAHWHTGDDGLDNIDRNTLEAVGQVVTAVVYNEAAGKLR